jgi:hypothetical protein
VPAFEVGLSRASFQPGVPLIDPMNGLMIGVVVAGETALTWQVEGLFTTKGGQATILPGAVIPLEIRASYLEFPCSVRFNLLADRRTHPFVTAGVAPGLRITGLVLRAYDVSAVVGGGVDTYRWTLSARYTRGFVDSHLSVDGRTLTNESWALVWAIKLR